MAVKKKAATASLGRKPASGSESIATRKKRAARIVKALRRLHPGASTALNHSNALELLVATILSAQCTDVRVNQVTEKLFKKYRTAKDFAEADPVVFAEEIRSTGFFQNKTKSVLGCCRVLLENHGGEVPREMEDLVALPGVGRKTANVVRGIVFGLPGTVVDTHVKRLAGRLKLTTETNPDKIEKDIDAVVSEKDRIFFSSALILHGRGVCKARKPDCGSCLISTDCPSSGQV